MQRRAAKTSRQSQTAWMTWCWGSAGSFFSDGLVAKTRVGGARRHPLMRRQSVLVAVGNHERHEIHERIALTSC